MGYNKKFAVIFWNITVGIQSVHGPFSCAEDADIWASEQDAGRDYVIHEVRAP